MTDIRARGSLWSTCPCPVCRTGPSASTQLPENRRTLRARGPARDQRSVGSPILEVQFTWPLPLVSFRQPRDFLLLFPVDLERTWELSFRLDVFQPEAIPLQDSLQCSSEEAGKSSRAAPETLFGTIEQSFPELFRAFPLEAGKCSSPLRKSSPSSAPVWELSSTECTGPDGAPGRGGGGRARRTL